jgi:carbon storage regulator
MLVLSRKENESIVINENIKIIVAEIQGSKVRLAIEAPKEVPVHHHQVPAKLNVKKAVENLNSMNGGRT